MFCRALQAPFFFCDISQTTVHVYVIGISLKDRLIFTDRLRLMLARVCVQICLHRFRVEGRDAFYGEKVLPDRLRSRDTVRSDMSGAIVALHGLQERRSIHAKRSA